MYVEANAGVKRGVLHAVLEPVHGLDMQSPELLKLVEECPKGAETLVTRMLHILTDMSEFAAAVANTIQCNQVSAVFLCLRMPGYLFIET